jgi:hypothetical protein
MTTFTREQVLQIEAVAKEVLWPVIWTEKKARAHFSEKITPEVVMELARIALSALTAEPSTELVAARAKIEWLSGKLNAATDSKCDGATFYDASGRERCASCGRDI